MLKHSITFTFTALLLLVISVAFAQQRIADVIDPSLKIERDVRLDSLVMRHVRSNEQQDGLEGYRVQLFSGSGTEARQQANNLRAEFISNYPDIPAYLVYQVPNFKVRVGDCRTELEAIRLQRKLAYVYPGGFVSKDLIKFPKLAIEVEAEANGQSLPRE